MNARRQAIPADQSVRRAILVSMDRQHAIEMIARGLRNAAVGKDYAGGDSLDSIWRTLNGARHEGRS